jgi:hypothetical protein
MVLMDAGWSQYAFYNWLYWLHWDVTLHSYLKNKELCPFFSSCLCVCVCNQIDDSFERIFWNLSVLMKQEYVRKFKP